MKNLLTTHCDFFIQKKSIWPSEDENLQIEILASKLSIKAFLPNRDALGNEIPDYNLWVEDTKELFKNLLGGYYCTLAQSNYLTKQGIQTLEETLIISSSLFANSKLCQEQVIMLLIRHLVLFGIHTKQESVLLSINNIERKIII